MSKLPLLLLLFIGLTTVIVSCSGACNIFVDLDAQQVTVNPDIYGVNNAVSSHLQSVRYTTNRWSGNVASRYNWEKGSINTGAVYFFLTVPDEVKNVSALPEGTQVTIHMDDSLKYNSTPMLTIPMLGWVNNDDRTRQWGFSVKKYGAQRETECTRTKNASYCNADMASGILMNGTTITYNDRYDTSKPVPEDYGLKLAEFMKKRGTPVKFWALDNEIDIWSETHKDLYKKKMTYDEMWRLTEKYGKMVKDYDPSIQTFAPSLSGVCGFWFSDIDECSHGADRIAHNNLPTIAFMLNQTCSYTKRNGIQLFDYLDIHFYPPGLGAYQPSAPSDWNYALRLRQVRNLYDFNYVDESWIGNDNKQWQYKVPALIPRMKNYIENYCPGIKLAITEYNYGGYNLYSSGLSQIEILSIFAKYGVDYANYFQVPTVGSVVENSFRFYLNYDGHGSKLSGDFINGTTSDVQSERLTGYTYFDKEKKQIFTIVINKFESNQTVQVYLQSETSKYGDLTRKTAQVFSFKKSTHETKGLVRYLNKEYPVRTDSKARLRFEAEPLSAYLLIISTIDDPEEPTHSESKPSPRNSENRVNTGVSGVSYQFFGVVLVVWLILCSY